MIVCGKRVSLCCAFISSWGILMLTIMGILLYSHSIAFAEDLELENFYPDNTNEFIKEAYQRYESAAHNCWIAVCLYIATLAISLQQYYMNRKEQYGI